MGKAWKIDPCEKNIMQNIIKRQSFEVFIFNHVSSEPNDKKIFSTSKNNLNKLLL